MCAAFKAPLLAPDITALRFEGLARPLQAKMEQLLLQSRTLAAVRDVLLPKLISGELRVNAAERLVAETV